MKTVAQKIDDKCIKKKQKKQTETDILSQTSMSAFVLSPGADVDLDADFVYGKLQQQRRGYQLRH